jgi:ubiquinone/menaquinone biosynthesis C-methylase UbiE
MVRARKDVEEYSRTVTKKNGKVILEYESLKVPERLQEFQKIAKDVPYLLQFTVQGNLVEFPWLENTKNLCQYKPSVQEKKVIRRQVLEFIVKLNAHGWAHRDLHQGNILWDGKKIIVVDLEYICPNPVPLRECYDLTGKGLPSPLRSSNMHVFHKARQALVRLFPDMTIEDFLEEKTRQMSKKEPTLSVAMMGHPSREKWFPYLREKLGPNAKFIIDHDSEGVWPNARKAWAAFDPEADYHLVIQDDAIVCENFYERVQDILKKGHKAYCLYWGNVPKGQRSAAEAGLKRGYVVKKTPLWGVAVILSTDIIQGMLDWTGQHNWPSNWGTLADDTRICKYLKRKNCNIYYPLPSLVDHRVEENPTLTDRKKPERHALYFIDTYKKENTQMYKGLDEVKNKYVKGEALNYEKTRKNNTIWKKEDEVILKLLQSSPPKSVLDVPVGTGRFLPFYKELGVKEITGVDISSDMIAEAKKKGVPCNYMLGNVQTLPLGDDSFDTTVCFRLVTWMNRNDLFQVAGELLRVTKNRIIVSAWTSSVTQRRGSTGPIVHSYDDWFAAWRGKEMTAYPIHNTRKGNYVVYDIDLTV